MDVSQYLEIFVEETKEHLQSLNDNILVLENEPENKDTINEIFRSAHSLKGMAGTMGYKRMQTLTHDMENVFSEIRNDKSSEEVNALFLCCVSSQAGVISPFAGLPQYLLSSTAGRSQCVRFCRKRISQPFPRFGNRLDKCQVQ